MSESDKVSAELRRQSLPYYHSTDKVLSDDESDDGHTELSLLCFWRQRRSVVAILAFLGFCNVYAMRVNLSVAVVAMTQPTNYTIAPNGTIIQAAEFDWDSRTTGLVLSSFFYGYLVTQLPGGWLAANYGGNRVYAYGIGATSLLTLLTPLAARSSVGLLLALRVAEGLFEGVTYPCVHAVWSQWAPPSERTRLATLAFSGSYVGTVISLPLCSLLADHLGWPSIFYFFGVVGLVWTAAWAWVVKEKPDLDPNISHRELAYIQRSLGAARDASSVRHPWSSILRSAPVWAIVTAHFSENWGFYTLLTFLPTYMSDVFSFNLSSAGFLSAIPYLAMAVTLQLAGHFADYLRKRNTLSVTNIRKVFNCGGFISQTVFMMGAAYSSSISACIICLTIAVGLGGFAWAGFSVNHLDIGGPHASILMGLSNTFATLPGIVSPTIAGYIVTDKSPAEWRTVFTISSAIYLLGAIVYGIWCSGERQPWAKQETRTQNARNPNEHNENPAYLGELDEIAK